MKKTLALIMAGAMCLGLAACGGAAAPAGNGGAAGDTIRIGVFEPSTGDSASGGKKEILGMQYANSETPTVEVGGKTYNVELVMADNGSSADKAPSAASIQYQKRLYPYGR